MLIPRKGGPILLGLSRPLSLSGLFGPLSVLSVLSVLGVLDPAIGAFPNTPPGNAARTPPQKKPLAEGWPGLTVGIARPSGAIPPARFARCAASAEISTHG